MPTRPHLASFPLWNVAVIGAAGRMGQWFTYYFSQISTTDIFLFDTNKIAFKIPKDVHRCETIQACVKEADLVVVCVPIENIVPVVKNCLSLMKQGAVLCEISSIKKNVFGVLQNARKDVTCLCIHPMFGPASNKSRNIKCLLVPVRDQAREHGLLNSIFPRSEIEVIRDPELHDRYMAVVIGLTYYVNVVLGSVISKLDLKMLKKVAGTTFGMQAIITESVLNDSPELVASLLRENPFNMRYIMEFLTAASNISKLVSAEEEDAITRRVEGIKIRLNKLTDTNKSYLNFYKALEYIETLDNRE